jgi:hypothetical protein
MHQVFSYYGLFFNRLDGITELGVDLVKWHSFLNLRRLPFPIGLDDCSLSLSIAFHDGAFPLRWFLGLAHTSVLRWRRL